VLLVFSLSRVKGFVSEALCHASLSLSLSLSLSAALYITTTLLLAPLSPCLRFQFLMTELRSLGDVPLLKNIGAI